MDKCVNFEFFKISPLAAICETLIFIKKTKYRNLIKTINKIEENKKPYQNKEKNKENHRNFTNPNISEISRF